MTIDPIRGDPPARTRRATRRPAPHPVAMAALLACLACSLEAQATDVAKKPVRGALLVEPNVVFVYDDSGSMDAEILLDTTEGALWWNAQTKSGWAQGSGLNRPADQLDGSSMHQFRKLFPQLGFALGAGIEGPTVNPNLARAAPPIAQLAWLRSSRFNRLYYDTLTTYEPWPAAIEPGQTAITTYGPANATAAKTHPSASLSPLTVDLTVDQDPKAPFLESFRFVAGMRYPAGAVDITSSGPDTITGPNALGTALIAGQELASGQKQVAVRYYPATFWHPTPCLPIGIDCVNAPDGNGTLKRFEIKPGVSFPSGRSVAAELANFANWWQYHRKRRLMTAAVLGRLLTGLGEGLRIGHLDLNTAPSGSASPPAHPPLQLASTTGAGGDGVRRRLAGHVYNRAWLGGATTPTRRALQHVLDQFDQNPGVIQHACQRNYQLVITDGFATDTGPQGSAPDAPPLHALAKTAYQTRLRAKGPHALPAGLVPPGDPARPNPDLSVDLHLNTYAISLGLTGLLWPAQDADGDSVPDAPVAWPASPTRREKIDDLWGAAVEGKGAMLLANDAASLSQALGRVLFDITGVQGTQGGAAFSSVNLTDGAFALLSSYNAGRWNGDLRKRAVDPATGQVSDTDLWSAAARLDALADPAARVLFTGTGAFDAAGVGPSINLGVPTPPAVTAAKVDYLRGARDQEGFGPGQFRPRLSRFGAVAGSVPALNAARTIAFVAANDGFLRAVDLADGKELWSFAPKAVLAEMGRSIELNWSFKTYHDGSPQVGRVAGVEMLFGGLGSGGAGWYALDVSQAAAPMDAAQRAATVKWELPGANTTLQQQMGLSVGRPLLVRTAAHGEVLLLTSGYNAPVADGRGRLFVIDPKSGDVLRTLQTPVVEPGSDPGLAQVSAFLEVDGSVRYVFGGDEHGNVWRFDLAAAATAPVARLATLKDGAGRAQPITARPALVEHKGRRIVLVGTGRMLGVTDLTPESRGNSFYALRDDGADAGDPRSSLIRQTVTVNAADDTRRIQTPLAMDWSTHKGWFIDLPDDERANLPPVLGSKAVAFVTNQPRTDPCRMRSYRYALDIVNGSPLPDAPFGGSVIGSPLPLDQGAAGSSVIVSQGSAGTPGGVDHCVTGLDGKLVCDDLEKDPPGKPRKAGWRRVVR